MRKDPQGQAGEVRGDESCSGAVCSQDKGSTLGEGGAAGRPGGWRGVLLGQWAWALQSPGMKAAVEAKEDLEPESPVTREGWRLQRGAQVRGE